MVRRLLSWGRVQHRMHSTAPTLLDARNRAFGFGLIADALAGVPCARSLAAMRSPAALQVFATHGIPFSIDGLPGPDGARLYAWICEFDDLFTGRGDPILPFETIYVSGDRSVAWGARAEAVRDFVELWGLEPRPVGRRLDHIAVELNIVGDLAAREADLASHGDGDEARRARDAATSFVDAHLVPWIERLAADVIARAHIFLFRDFLQLAVALVLNSADRTAPRRVLSTERLAT